MNQKFFGATTARACGASVIFVALALWVTTSTLRVAASPPAQNPLPTDEPTKRPYVFPTPIFIPTFVSATDLPPRPATPTPRVPTTIPATPALSTAAVTAQPKPSATLAEIEPDATEEPEVIETPPDDDGLLQAAANALLAMSIVLFLGFIGISITAYIIYQRNQRAERIAFIKNRLKGQDPKES